MKAIQNMLKTRWKHGNHSIEADMSVIVFKEELSDLYDILKTRHENKMFSEAEAFELKSLMDRLTHYLGVIQQIPSGERSAYEIDKPTYITDLKRVYKILNIKY